MGNAILDAETGTNMKVILAYKNFAANRNISHIGLGVAATTTQKVLRRAGVPTQVWPIKSASDLQAQLAADSRVTHVVISAPWIPSTDLQRMTSAHPEIRFSVVCHSNVGFLQADTNGVMLMRQAMELETGTHNFNLGGNCQKFTCWVQNAYGRPCALLPNLYYLDEHTNPHRPLYTGGTLRIGAFGATRPLKNLMSAAGAALELARTYKTDTELWLSSGRAEGGGETVHNAIGALLAGVPNMKLVPSGWQTWPQFRQTVGQMHLLLQPSYTESFNMVTADGIAQGVPSVVSDAIDWVPRNWQAKADDVCNIARTGRHLQGDPHAASDGLRALQSYVDTGLRAWMNYLNSGF